MGTGAIRTADILGTGLLIIAFVVAGTAVYKSLVLTGSVLTSLLDTYGLGAIVVRGAAIRHNGKDTTVFNTATDRTGIAQLAIVVGDATARILHGLKDTFTM